MTNLAVFEDFTEMYKRLKSIELSTSDISQILKDTYIPDEVFVNVSNQLAIIETEVELIRQKLLSLEKEL